MRRNLRVCANEFCQLQKTIFIPPVKLHIKVKTHYSCIISISTTPEETRNLSAIDVVQSLKKYQTGAIRVI